MDNLKLPPELEITYSSRKAGFLTLLHPDKLYWENEDDLRVLIATSRDFGREPYYVFVWLCQDKPKKYYENHFKATEIKFFGRGMRGQEVRDYGERYKFKVFEHGLDKWKSMPQEEKDLKCRKWKRSTKNQKGQSKTEKRSTSTTDGRKDKLTYDNILTIGLARRNAELMEEVDLLRSIVKDSKSYEALDKLKAHHEVLYQKNRRANWAELEAHFQFLRERDILNTEGNSMVDGETREQRLERFRKDRDHAKLYAMQCSDEYLFAAQVKSNFELRLVNDPDLILPDVVNLHEIHAYIARIDYRPAPVEPNQEPSPSLAEKQNSAQKASEPNAETPKEDSKKEGNSQSASKQLISKEDPPQNPKTPSKSEKKVQSGIKKVPMAENEEIYGVDGPIGNITSIHAQAVANMEKEFKENSQKNEVVNGKADGDLKKDDHKDPQNEQIVTVVQKVQKKTQKDRKKNGKKGGKKEYADLNLKSTRANRVSRMNKSMIFSKAEFDDAEDEDDK